MVETGENGLPIEGEAHGAVGLGLRLRLAREARGWSVAEVAQRLCLNKQVIIDIEAEEYGNMPGVVYLRGFTRAYAKLLALPVDEVMREFDGLGLQQKLSQPPRLQLIRTRRMKSKSKGRWLSVLTVIIILVMVGLVIIWWHNKSARPSQSPFSTTSNEVTVPPLAVTKTSTGPLDANQAKLYNHSRELAQQMFSHQQETVGARRETGNRSS